MRHGGPQTLTGTPTPNRSATAAVAALTVLVAGATTVATRPWQPAAAPNLIVNSGFERNLDGWAALQAPLKLQRAKGGHSGSWSAALSDTSTDTVALRDSPDVVLRTRRGAVYHASVWVKAPQGPVDAVLRIREVLAGHLVGQHLAHLAVTGRGWHQIHFDYTTVTSGAQLDYNVLARDLPAGRTLLVDDTWLSSPDASPAPKSPTATATPPGAPTGRPHPAPTPASAPTPAPAPTTAPKPVPTAPGESPPPRGTLFGSSIYQNPGETFAAAYQRRVSLYGQLGVDRVFYPGLPPAWPGEAGYSGGPVVVSFNADPQQVLAGGDDATLRSWFDTAPRGRGIWWSYYHEPEDQIARGQFTAAQYRAAWRHIWALAGSAGNPDLHATLILMCYTLDPASGRTFSDYYPGSAFVDTLGFDCYNTALRSAGYVSPVTEFSAVLRVSAALGKPFGIAELGSQLVAGDRGTGRARWLRTCAGFLDAHGAQWVTYFDSPVHGEYRLLDAASQSAWRTVVTTL